MAIFYNLFHLVHSEVHDEQTPAPPNITRSTLLEGAQRSPELVFRSMDFCVPENQIFSALTFHVNQLGLVLVVHYHSV